MSLAFSVSLTSAQVEFLQACHLGHYDMKDGKAFLQHDSAFFVATGQSLITKGLVSHDPKRDPAWLATEEGHSIAKLILRDAKTMVAKSADVRKVFVSKAKPESRTAMKGKS